MLCIGKDLTCAYWRYLQHCSLEPIVEIHKILIVLCGCISSIVVNVHQYQQAMPWVQKGRCLYDYRERIMKRLRLVIASSVILTSVAGQVGATEPAPNSNMADRGRYIAQVSGCNDCHTPGYLLNDGNVPVEQWLSGDSFGWRGPWGTTYPPNLRLFVSNMTEDEWVITAKSLRRRPPMPWFNLNAMSKPDLRALYQFMRSLGEPGQPAPVYLPPGEEPKTPYALFPSPPNKD